MIRETKPRKAKFAFEVNISKDILSDGTIFAKFNEILKNLPEVKDGAYWTDYRNGMGTWSLHIYINDEEIYHKLKAAM